MLPPFSGILKGNPIKSIFLGVKNTLPNVDHPKVPLPLEDATGGETNDVLL